MAKWFGKSKKKQDGVEELQSIRSKFADFLTLLENNNQALKILSDMEEKAHGEYLFDINYLINSLSSLRKNVETIIDKMISIGGENYNQLREIYNKISSEIDTLLPGSKPIEKDQFCIPLSEIDTRRVMSVGNKNAQLGELSLKLGLPVPPGFAISAWAYKHFIDANDLQNRISDKFSKLDVKCYADLLEFSKKIRKLILSSKVPDDLAAEIEKYANQMKQDYGTEHFAVRSSAIGEDSMLSFAGQYMTYLNVNPNEIVNRYRGVIASKFTPQAIYYFLCHSLSEEELAMSVCCEQMVDAYCSGVIYTCDPINADSKTILIDSIFGLGKYLVEGSLTPDIFEVSTEDLRIKKSEISEKPIQLVLDSKGETKIEQIPVEKQLNASLTEEQVIQLAKAAIKIEKYYEHPQDIEWAIDKKGQIFFLQSRPLKIIEKEETPQVNTSKYDLLLKGGITICPGAGAGPVYHASSTHELCDVPDNAVLVAPNSFPGIITAMNNVSAIITEIGGGVSHMATIAREYRVPTIGGLKGATAFKPGQLVTVDATNCRIYADIQSDILKTYQRKDSELFCGIIVLDILKNTLRKVSKLNLLHPTDENFKTECCKTFHDITRFAHQKAMEEIFYGARRLRHKDHLSFRLESEIPLKVNVIFLDEERDETTNSENITEKEIHSDPMCSFWEGIKQEGWHSSHGKSDYHNNNAMKTDFGRKNEKVFGEESFAIISKEYMILSLHLGYHFTTVEAMCTNTISKNYIQMQYKEGGAPFDRRIRRVRLITEILSCMGFEYDSTGDFFSSMITYQSRDDILEKLNLLGRLTMKTKQLDMALSNDAVTQWYIADFMRSLGLGKN